MAYEALTGKNEQYVPDCERLISKRVISFMEKNCHHAEAKILSIIHNWHKAVDGRGLSEETRAQYCKDMMTLLLKVWMPYLDQDHDYSTVDVNRYCIMPYMYVLITCNFKISMFIFRGHLFERRHLLNSSQSWALIFLGLCQWLVARRDSEIMEFFWLIAEQKKRTNV